MLGQRELERVELPIGEMTKPEVREHASRLGLRTATKPDSQDICFVGNGDYRDFLREHFPEAAVPGPVVDTAGAVIGRHDGTVDYTIGQRRGLGVAVGERRYVVDIQPQTATVVLGRKADLRVNGCEVEDLTFVSGRPPADASLQAQIRYRSRPFPARLETTDRGHRLVFAEPQHGVAPGQSAVLYDGDEVLGGGVISAAFA